MAVVVSFALAPGAVALQPQSSWRNSSELSFVQTGGNAASSTLGIASTLTRSWDRTEVKIEAGGVRTRTTRFTRTAVGTATDFRLSESSESETSAENYRARLRIDRRFSDRTSVFVQSEWNRNTFAGIRNRYLNVAGVSTRWIENENQSLRTAYGFTHTVQQDVVTDPDAAGRFLGVRLSSEYWRKLTGNTEWRSNLALDGNGDDHVGSAGRLDQLSQRGHEPAPRPQDVSPHHLRQSARAGQRAADVPVGGAGWRSTPTAQEVGPGLHRGLGGELLAA